MLSFVAAPFRLGPRDAFLGWDDRRRGAHIERILNNDRFVLVAGVQVPNLASHVLGQTTQRLSRDWEQAHGVRPWLVETSCEVRDRAPVTRRPAGSAWEPRGAAAGSRRGGRDEGAVATGRGAGPAAAAVPAAAAEAGAVPGVGAGRGGQLGSPGVSALGPAGRARAGAAGTDGQSWERHPGEDLPAIFPRQADLRAATRHLHNGRVSDTNIPQLHRKALLERVQVESTVLLVQDTTTLNYTSLQG